MGKRSGRESNLRSYETKSAHPYIGDARSEGSFRVDEEYDGAFSQIHHLKRGPPPFGTNEQYAAPPERRKTSTSATRSGVFIPQR